MWRTRGIGFNQLGRLLSLLIVLIDQSTATYLGTPTVQRNHKAQTRQFELLNYETNLKTLYS